MMKLKMKSVKDEQLNVRNAVDADHLLLQNLLYEATHLQNQVSAVQDYKYVSLEDLNLNLITVVSMMDNIDFCMYDFFL